MSGESVARILELVVGSLLWGGLRAGFLTYKRKSTIVLGVFGRNLAKWPQLSSFYTNVSDCFDLLLGEEAKLNNR